jgi:hypothetical protein
MQRKRSVLELRLGGRRALCSSWHLNARCCSSRSSSCCYCPLLSRVFAFGLDHMGFLTAMQAVRRQSELHTRRVEEQQLQHQACTCCTQHGQACSALSSVCTLYGLICGRCVCTFLATSKAAAFLEARASWDLRFLSTLSGTIGAMVLDGSEPHFFVPP